MGGGHVVLDGVQRSHRCLDHGHVRHQLGVALVVDVLVERERDQRILGPLFVLHRGVP